MKSLRAHALAEAACVPKLRVWGKCAECGESGLGRRWIAVRQWADELERVRTYRSDLLVLPLHSREWIGAVCPACWSGPGGEYARRWWEPGQLLGDFRVPLGLRWFGHGDEERVHGKPVPPPNEAWTESGRRVWVR